MIKFLTIFVLVTISGVITVMAGCTIPASYYSFNNSALKNSVMNQEQISKVYTGWFKKLQSSGRNQNEFINVLIRASKLYFGINEEWKNIEDYEGLYQISTFGRAKSLKRHATVRGGGERIVNERILKPGTDRRGYFIVSLYKNGKRKTRSVHQLEAIAFKGHKSNGHVLVVNHKNFIRTDNRLYNLEIITNRENTNQQHLKSSSKYTGVSWKKTNNKWKAQIEINGKSKFLGYFKVEHEAHLAYQNELNKLL